MSRSVGRNLFALLIGASLIVIMAGCRPQLESRDSMSRMAPCPESPNCVSTLAEDEGHGIAPLTFDGSVDEARSRLLTIIQSMPRTNIVEDDGDYVHAEFTSRIFRFVDDVEFQINGDEGVIHFRSASRTGVGDLGANRKRMEEIRWSFDAAQ